MLKWLIMASIMVIISVNGIVSADIGENWNRTCNDRECSIDLYSYEKFYFNESLEWEEIIEDYYLCESQGKYKKYCSNTYHFNSTVDTDLYVSGIKKTGNHFTVKIKQLFGFPLKFDLEVDGSVANFVGDTGHINITYQYLPRSLKETIIFDNLEFSWDRQNITFEKRGFGDFIMDDAVFYDSSGNMTIFNYTMSDDEINIEIPSSLEMENYTFPWYIDPTIHLNETNITWDGYVCKTLAYSRTNNPASQLRVGTHAGIGSPVCRSDMDFNTTAIPDTATIHNITLNYYIDAGSDGSITVNNYQMEGNNTIYPNNNAGNTLFWNDMGNGSIYASQTLIVVPIQGAGISKNLSVQALTDMTDQLPVDWWSVGLKVTVETKKVFIGSKTNPTPIKRANITVVYTIPEEDTCTYSSGDWIVDCSDNCLIEEETDVGGNDIIITGTGTFTVKDVNITNFNRLYTEGTDSSNICRVTCLGGCFRT